jgi:hypothetical protein
MLNDYRKNDKFRKNGRGFVAKQVGPFYVQVHFAATPGATKKHLDAIQREITEKTQDMTRRGILIIAGRYLSSVGGMWLLKVNTKEEAEKHAREHPAVKSNLVKFRLKYLQDPTGMLLRRDPNVPVVEEEKQEATVGA